MPSLSGFHRMSSSCAIGATASGGVTFIRSTVLKTMRKENLLDMRKLYVTTLKGAVRPITTASMLEGDRMMYKNLLD